MNRFSSYAAIVARALIALVFLINAVGMVDQSVVAKELVERGAPAGFICMLMFIGRSIELIGGFALLLGFFPRTVSVGLMGFLVKHGGK